MILNQTDFFARSATLDGAITGTDTQITLAGLSTRFTDAVAAGTAGYEGGTALGPFRVSDDDGFELISITGHVSGTTFEVERGIQGTTEEAWPDGTAVRAVVTRRQLVDSPLVYAQNPISPHQPVFTFDDFDYPDGPIDGRVMPSGLTWEAGQGHDIISGALGQSEGSPSIGSGPKYAINNPILSHHAHGELADRDPLVAFYLAYVDDDNHIEASLSGTFNLRIRKRVSGSTTTLTSSSVSSAPMSPFYAYAFVALNAQTDTTRFKMDAGRLGVVTYDSDWGSDPEIDDILKNATRAGIYARGLGSPRPESNTQIFGYSARTGVSAIRYQDFLNATA